MKTISRNDWKRWRIAMGVSPREANRLYKRYREWVDAEALNGRVRVFKVESWQDWEEEFRRFLDQMPRKPYAFLAMVAALEKKRAQQNLVQERKAVNRARYEKAYARRAR